CARRAAGIHGLDSW
nr:immunoglobulin heavy chain junction region [Macaca mulatta]